MRDGRYGVMLPCGSRARAAGSPPKADRPGPPCPTGWGRHNVKCRSARRRRCSSQNRSSTWKCNLTRCRRHLSASQPSPRFLADPSFHPENHDLMQPLASDVEAGLEIGLGGRGRGGRLAAATARAPGELRRAVAAPKHRLDSGYCGFLPFPQWEQGCSLDNGRDHRISWLPVVAAHRVSQRVQSRSLCRLPPEVQPMSSRAFSASAWRQASVSLRIEPAPRQIAEAPAVLEGCKKVASSSGPHPDYSRAARPRSPRRRRPHPEVVDRLESVLT
jgi:hypothetical protein